MKSICSMSFFTSDAKRRKNREIFTADLITRSPNMFAENEILLSLESNAAQIFFCKQQVFQQ